MSEELSEIVEINIPTESFIELALRAHEADVTLNSYINKILRDYVHELQSESFLADDGSADLSKT